MSKHTPGPWFADAMTGGSYCITTGTAALADVWTTEADAEFIVRACNRHEELLKTLKLAVELLEGYIQNDEAAYGNGSGTYDIESREQVRDLTLRCRAVLNAAAEG